MTTNKYFSYLIRIWQDEGPMPGDWHASLEDPSTQLMIHFHTLDELFEFLHQKSLSEGKYIEQQTNQSLNKHLVVDKDHRTRN